MQIHVFGNTALISSVYVGKVPIGMTAIISCARHGTPYHYAGQRSEAFATMSLEAIGLVPRHECHQVYGAAFDVVGDAAAQADVCDVVLVPETEQDISLLGGLQYEMHEKDQIVLLRVPYQHLLPVNDSQLALYASGRQVRHD